MAERPQLSISKLVRSEFVGREEPLDVYYERFAYRHTKNGVYYFGPGGGGKTWLIQKILLDNQVASNRVATDIVDFFNTQNQSVFGLQAAIRSRLEPLGELDTFARYDSVLARLDEIHRGDSQNEQELAAGLESRASKVFIECCNNAILGKEVLMLFDTFERVQQLNAGQWLLRQFLPQTRDLIVVICGRPVLEHGDKYTPAKVPNNILPYELPGFDADEMATFVRKFWPETLQTEVIEMLRLKTNGNPLLVRLVLDQCAGSLSDLEKLLKAKNEGDLCRKLAGAYTDPSPENKLIWVMASFRRRFNLDMLRYLVRHGEILDILGIREDSYNHAVERLERRPFFKEYPEQQSHLLHDEMQRIVEDYIIGGVFPGGELERLYNVVVLGYYPEAIEGAESELNSALAQQLKAEQLGYIIRHQPSPGVQHYKEYVKDVEKKHNYDFEELLWGEIRSFRDTGAARERYELFKDRGDWLKRYNLYAKAVDHYREMQADFPDQAYWLNQPLGFCLLQLGESELAIQAFETGLNLIQTANIEPGISSERLKGEFENLLGQAYIDIGRWDDALEHLTKAIEHFAHSKSRDGIAGGYINRSYIYALKGLTSDAIEEAERALKSLAVSDAGDSLSNRRRVYANVNLGTAYRHAGNYVKAEEIYTYAQGLADSFNDQNGLCSALQQLGINNCLHARVLRRSERYTDAIDKLSSAWGQLTRALDIAYRTGWFSGIGDGLSRLAKVYEEIYRLSVLVRNAGAKIDNQLENLKEKAARYEPRTEVERQHELLLPAMGELDWLGKAARLFELSAFVADEVNDFHRALDSLMEFARLLIETGNFDLVRLACARTDHIKGYDYQTSLFTAMNELTLADLDFEMGKLDQALPKYVEYFAQLAMQTGYASYLLTDRLREFRKHLMRLPQEIRQAWCQTLEKAWRSKEIAKFRPDMLRMLEDIRLGMM